ncbi:MAG TPA: carbohydrate kinase family protein [Candidatus Paceibacterota bacterium]|nr:carbohydrate kinase family protein [Candidatus Paceibacterota bacterium]
MFDIATIGKATRDAFFEGGFPLIKWPKAESGKAYLLPFGEKLDVKRIYFTIGGNAANASVTFARQGFKVACAAKTGNDVSGEEIRRRLKKEKVESKFVVYDKKLPTSYSVLLLEKGERTILNYLGASTSFSMEDLDMKKIIAKWWYVSLPGNSGRMFREISDFAGKHEIALAFNPSGYHIKHRRKEILSLMEKLSFMVLNEEEAAMLARMSFRDKEGVFTKLNGLMNSRQRQASLGAGILAVTDGKNGVTVSDGRFVYKAGTFKEKKLVDRTGAGDAFGSGFVAGLMRRGLNAKNMHSVKSDDVCHAIRTATANATAGVEKIGSTEGVLTKNGFEKDKRWKNLKITIIKI